MKITNVDLLGGQRLVKFGRYERLLGTGVSRDFTWSVKLLAMVAKITRLHLRRFPLTVTCVVMFHLLFWWNSSCCLGYCFIYSWLPGFFVPLRSGPYARWPGRALDPVCWAGPQVERIGGSSGLSILLAMEFMSHLSVCLKDSLSLSHLPSR